jgi:hypothetical protein
MEASEFRKTKMVQEEVGEAEDLEASDFADLRSEVVEGANGSRRLRFFATGRSYSIYSRKMGKSSGCQTDEPSLAKDKGTVEVREESQKRGKSS